MTAYSESVTHHMARPVPNKFLPSEKDKKILLSLKGKHAGESVWLWCNGPSLNKADLPALRDRVNFTMNRAYIIFDDLGFESQYWICAEGAWLHPLVEELKTFGSFKLVPRKYRFIVGDKFHEQNGCLYPHPSPGEITECLNGPFPDAGFGLDPSARVELWRQGTMGAALQFIYYMGFVTVYLIGCDWRYYAPTEVPGQGKNYFRPDVLPADFKFTPHFLKGIKATEEGLWVANHDRWEFLDMGLCLCRKVFEADGRTIYNVTEGGALEVFPRIGFCEALEKG